MWVFKHFFGSLRKKEMGIFWNDKLFTLGPKRLIPENSRIKYQEKNRENSYFLNPGFRKMQQIMIFTQTWTRIWTPSMKNPNKEQAIRIIHVHNVLTPWKWLTFPRKCDFY